MVSNYFSRRQANVFSAAAIIGLMIAVSEVLGFVRYRVLTHFFSAERLSVYFAAFRLPETIFEVLVFGALSSAFIPTFTSYLSKKKESQAWYVAGVCLNLALLIFFFLALLIFFLARPLYQIIAPGFSSSEINEVVSLARILIFTQGFFLLSYFLTGVLESLQRFLIPAIAPLFYNLGIISGTILFSNRFGLYAPVLGAVAGAFFHFCIQLPLAIGLGFRPQVKLDPFHPGVRKIGKLAAPRVIELFVLQFAKSSELFLASLVATPAYTWFTFANSLQLLPSRLFGVSIGKASLPAFSRQVTERNLIAFKKTFLASFNQIIFWVVPLAVFLAVLRIPLVRLVFGSRLFTWESTVQTSYTLSAFCLGISSQALISLLSRAFYAFHETKTAVKASILSIFLNIALSFLLILIFHFPIWGVAFASSLASIICALILLFLLDHKVGGFERKNLLMPLTKISFASLFSGSLMFFLLKIFDRSAWDKRLSFLGYLGLKLPTTFERFVLDTRYTINLIILTLIVGSAGIIVYLFLAWILKVKEFKELVKLLRRSRA